MAFVGRIFGAGPTEALRVKQAEADKRLEAERAALTKAAEEAEELSRFMSSPGWKILHGYIIGARENNLKLAMHGDPKEAAGHLARASELDKLVQRVEVTLQRGDSARKQLSKANGGSQ